MLTTSEQILEQLIAFPTVSRDSNLALIGFVRDCLHEHGIESVLIHNGDDDVMLTRHTNVVPVDSQDWTRDAFRKTL